MLTSEKMFSRNPAAGRYMTFAASMLFLSFAIIGSSSTHNNSAPASAQEREAAAQAFVTQRLHLWQDRLDLKDWKIRVQLVRPSQLEPKTLGNIHWDTDVKQA